MPSHDNDLTVDTETLEAAVDDTTALVLLSHVVFKSGFVYDGRAVTELAHKVSQRLFHSSDVRMPSAVDFDTSARVSR